MEVKTRAFTEIKIYFNNTVFQSAKMKIIKHEEYLWCHLNIISALKCDIKEVLSNATGLFRYFYFL